MRVEFQKINDDLIIFENGVNLLTIQQASKDSDSLKYYSEDITEDLVAKIFQCDAADIPEGLHFFSKYFNVDFQIADWIELKKESDSVEIEISITFDFEKWDKPIVIGKFLELYSSELELSGFKTRIVKENVDSWASVNIYVPITNGRLIEYVRLSTLKSQKIHEQLLIKIAKSNATNSLVEIFEFPKEYEIICTQYVLWFGELLNSLGINANVATEIKAGKTSLIVSPTDAPELLEEIEKIFYQYLALPYSEYLPSNNESTSNIERATYQLLANQVEFFKLQIQMKDSMLQLKDATISSLTIDNQRVSSELVLLKSIKKNDELEVLGGAVSIGEFKWGAVKINFKKIVEIFNKKV